jgi:uroporphyrinogen III methyltransferase/synthase
MKSLAGQRVVITRASHQAEELAAPLRAVGAEVILLPTIEIVPAADPGPLKNAAANLERYDWIVFSSTNAVAALAQHLTSDRPPLRGRIATVGTATREAVEKLGWRVDVVPEKFVAESLVEAIPPEKLRGRRVLLPAAAATRNVIPQALRERGAIVEAVEAYRNVVPADAAQRARQVFSNTPPPDWVTFTSSSAVENLVSLIPVEVLQRVRIASIGSVTSGSIQKYGLRVDVQPEEHTVAALVEAMAAMRC